MVPWAGGAVCVSDHVRDVVHSSTNFAESLHVPVFVSCCPQGPGLRAEWLQDKNLCLPLDLEGQVGVMGRDLPKVTLTRLQGTQGQPVPAFPCPALPVSGSPGGSLLSLVPWEAYLCKARP